MEQGKPTVKDVYTRAIHDNSVDWAIENGYPIDMRSRLTWARWVVDNNFPVELAPEVPLWR